MSDLISRAYLLEVFKKFPATNGAIPKNAVEALIEDAPVADNVVHGEWEYKWFDSICSVCGFLNKAEMVTRLRNDWPYCPKCGAKMDLKQALAEMEK